MDKADLIFRVRAHKLLKEGNPIWEDDPEFIKAFNEVEERTIVSPYRCYTLYQIARHANAVEGSFAQVGVYRGGSAKLISSVKSSKKQFYLFDTFEGLPEHDPEMDVYPKGKFGDTTLEEVAELFKDDTNVHMHKGRFPETAIHIPADERFAFVYLDADLYRSTFEALELFYPRMNTAGVIVFDDYGFENCPGVERSIRDFLRQTGAKETPIITAKYQAILIKS